MKFSLFTKLPDVTFDTTPIEGVPDVPIRDLRDIQGEIQKDLQQNIPLLVISGATLFAALLRQYKTEVKNPDAPYATTDGYNSSVGPGGIPYSPSGYDGRDIRAAVMGTTNYEKHGAGGAFGADRSWNRKKGTTGWAAKHQGVDIKAPVGTNVYAPFSGKVSSIHDSTSGAGGRSISIISDNGKYKTYICHLSSISVKAGQSVSAGQLIAKSGASGHGKEKAYEAHVHLQVGYTDTSIGPTGKGWVDPDTFSPSDLSFSSVAGSPTNEATYMSSTSTGWMRAKRVDGDIQTQNLSQSQIQSRINQVSVDDSKFREWFNSKKRQDNPKGHGAKVLNPGNVKGGVFKSGKERARDNTSGYEMTYASWTQGYADAMWLALTYASGKSAYMGYHPTIKKMLQTYCPTDRWAHGYSDKFAKMCDPSWTAYTIMPVKFVPLFKFMMIRCLVDSGKWNFEQGLNGARLAWATWLNKGYPTDSDIINTNYSTSTSTSSKQNVQPKTNTKNNQ